MKNLETRKERRKVKQSLKNGFYRKSGKRNRHHLIPKAKNGSTEPSNLLVLDTHRHRCWHCLFGIKTIDEVINLLERVRVMKGA